MTAPRKRVRGEHVTSNQGELMQVLLLRCQEKKLATSSLDKLPGVKGEWLHNIKVGRQKTTDVINVFALLDAIGLEMVIREKPDVAKRPSGGRVAHQLRSKIKSGLSTTERAEVQAALGEPVSSPPDVDSE